MRFSLQVFQPEPLVRGLGLLKEPKFIILGSTDSVERVEVSWQEPLFKAPISGSADLTEVYGKTNAQKQGIPPVELGSPADLGL